MVNILISAHQKEKKINKNKGMIWKQMVHDINYNEVDNIKYNRTLTAKD